jgi:thioester reductase-like protein
MSDLLERFARLSAAKRNFLLSQVPGGALQVLAKLLPTPLTRMSVEAMNGEAELEPSIDLSRATPSDGSRDSILLTGATGYLGAFLLEALLQSTRATIHCLVRAPGPEAARQRIADNLDRYLRRELPWDRIVPVAGDLSLPEFGLEPRAYEALACGVDTLFHCGAMVKWTYPYRALKAPNVEGTREILRLAVRRRVKPLHFISTVGVFSSPEFPASSVRETDSLDASGPLYVGYAQTKWVAEKLVTKARDRGLPVWIYRPNLASDSATGVFNPHDHVSLMLKACVQMGLTPDLNLRVSGAPVDFAARSIVVLSQIPPPAAAAYHLVNERDITWNELCRWFASRGYPLRCLPFSDWRAQILASAKTEGAAVLPLLPFVADEGFDHAKLPRFDCALAARHLLAAGCSCPAIDSDLLSRWLRFYQDSGYFGFAGGPAQSA